ncbi:MAG: hypothetical protein K9N23_19925 [Akkermansiaceae bacterium]|nr:hypothetical protein [Akkermansiaceae bacterium]
MTLNRPFAPRPDVFQSTGCNARCIAGLVRPFTDLLRTLFVVMLACASPLYGKEDPGIEKDLERFFELGLPDVKGAQWVKVECHDQEPVIPGTVASNVNDNFSGNGWLLSERKGRVEVLQSQGQLIRARRYRAGSRSPDEWDTTKEAVVRPADLDHDIKVFPKALEETARSHNPGTPQQRDHLVAAALLFLAELQRHGHAEFARLTLPEVLALAPSREKAFAAAWALVGEGRLGVIVGDWMNGGKTVATADALDALVAKFPEGWADREAVRLLATRMRRQEEAPLAGEPDAKEAAEFLMKLTVPQIEGLRFGNWLIPQRDEQQRYVPGGGFCGSSPFATAGGRETTDDAIAAFLAKRRETAAALVKLLDDRRFLRFAIRLPNERGSGNFSHDGSEQGATTGYRYDQLRRPGELGELAWRFLQPLLPENVRWPVETNPEDRAKLVAEWIGKVMTMNDEELAWFYLRASRNPEAIGFDNGPCFFRTLDFLTETGGPETLSKIGEVLLDAGAWDDLSFGELLVRVEEYLKRVPGDDAFADKLRAAVKSGLDAHEKRMGTSMGEWERKHLPGIRSAQAGLLEHALRHPGKLVEKFTAIAAMDKNEREHALRFIEAGLAKWPPAEVKAAVFQAVAAADSPEARRDLVRFLLDSYEPKGNWGSDGGWYEAVPPLPGDTATRAAMFALLHDESPFQDDSLADGRSTVADFTANAIFALGTGGGRRSRWEAATGCQARHLTTRWIRAQAMAMAMAAGDPPPPLPNPTKVSAARASALIRQLCALPPLQIAAVLTAKTPDEQLAVVAHLTEVEEWPAPLVKAHFTVGRISGGKLTDLGTDAWKGFQLDEKLVREITTAVYEAAVAGKYFTVTASIAGTLSGCEIQVEASPGGMTPEAFRDAGLPGLADKPAPRAVCRISIESGFFGFPEGSPRFGFPVWEDEALTKAWRSEHTHAPPAAGEPDDYYSEIGRKRIPANPEAFEKKLCECLKLSSYIRDPLRLTIMATGIDKGR